MAKSIPHADFPTVKMMTTVSDLTQKGNMRLQEMAARTTDEIMKEVFIAGYKQCMEDFGLTENSEIKRD